jgi:transcription factor E
MQEKLLKKIITEFAGMDAEKIVDLLYKKQNVNEFLIAKRMNMTINQTRNMLYKLADSGLVQFIRKKDRKKGGWYTYFWTLKIKRCLLRYKEKLQEESRKMQDQLLSRQKERYYYSPEADLEYTEEEAILNDYICPETGLVLQLKDNTPEIEKIKNGMREIEKQVAVIDGEVAEIEKKEGKVKEKRLKDEKIQKDEERRLRKVQRDKEKAKEAKKSGKKIPKKKEKPKKAAKKVAKKKSSFIRKAIKKFSKKKSR